MPYKNKHERHKLGLCNQCPNYLKPPFKRCAKCLKTDNKIGTIKMKRLKEKRKLEGKCTGCGYPLDKIADKGRVSCINCRES